MEEEKKIKIEIASGAYASGENYGSISNPTPMTADILKALSIAEDLEKYDDFAQLRIDTDAYRRKNDDDKYGIKVDKRVHNQLGDDVILKEQKQAAIRFLRDLRGFGLLADMVGSGKTFEAGVVISELAARGLISSILVIVPNDSETSNGKKVSSVMDQWLNVLENRFGFGEGVFSVVETVEDIIPLCDESSVQVINGNKLYVPTKPVIITHDNFDRWKDSDEFKNLLFHLVVVDEVHRFYLQKEDYPNAMFVLSRLMKNKKMANCPYCVLLSATPHSGNLINMFELWYFIRFKGGNPTNFLSNREKDEEYNKAKDEYLNVYCRGALTVSDFISESQSLKWTKMIEEKANITLLEKFTEFLQDKKHTYESYKSLTKSEKYRLQQEFLSVHESGLHRTIQKNIANDYHNGLMRKIMIRQRNTRRRIKRLVYNYFIYPTQETLSSPTLKFTFEGKDITVDINNLRGETISYEDYTGAIKHVSIDEFCAIIAREKNIVDVGRTYAELVCKILASLSGKKDSFDDSVFTKKQSLKFYNALLGRARKVEEEQDNFIPLDDYVVSPVRKREDAVAREKREDFENAERVFDIKLNLVKEIIDNNPNERVLIFFDYELAQDDVNARQWEKLSEKLKETYGDLLKGKGKNKGRVLCSYTGDAAVDVDTFERTPGAILVAWNKNFTESLNLQECRIIINFQVTPDPLAMDQRIGRIYRLGQSRDISIYSFAQMNRLDGYSLAYLNCIGLMNNINGDATIIAGSNNECMTAVRCPACNKVEMFTEGEVEAFLKKKDPKELRCSQTEDCRNNDKGYSVMTRIDTGEFICGNCQFEIRRGDEGYMCPKPRNTTEAGKIVQYKDKSYGCSKLCVIRHCDEFNRDRTKDKSFVGAFPGKKTLKEVCPVLNMCKEESAAEEGLNFAAYSIACKDCLARKMNICSSECGFMGYNGNDSATSACRTCNHASCEPFKYEFNESWVAVCPRCGKEKLHKKKEHTFAAYIKGAYNLNDGGESFCDNFRKETSKVETIKKILEQNEENDTNE